jgi:hypothetical protein
VCIARSTFTFSLRTESAVKSIGGSIAVIASSCSRWFWKMSRSLPPARSRRRGFDAHGLGDRDLHVVDELAVPDRLEDAVREPQREHVLHGLLAEVVVDPEDLALVEVLSITALSAREARSWPNGFRRSSASSPSRGMRADLAHDQLEAAGGIAR